MSKLSLRVGESEINEQAENVSGALIRQESPLTIAPLKAEERPVLVVSRIHREETQPVMSAPLAKAPVLRRAAAQIIDRLLPLPFLAVIFLPWLAVVIAYELFRDAAGASVGKRLMGLQTVIATGPTPGRPCNAGRSFLRNLGGSAVRILYAIPFLIPVGLTLDLIEALLAGFSPHGRRLGDLIAGTQVIARERGERK